MERIRLHLLGPPELVADGQPTRIKLRKAVALAAYLAVEERAFSRDYLAAMFWPSLGEKGALANLRRTLSVLKTAFGDGCLLSSGDLVSVDPASVTIDVREFRALAAVTNSDGDLDRLEAAVDLYRGSFLEGFNLGDCEGFDAWQDAVREKLNSELDHVLQTLTQRHLEEERPRDALEFGWKWIQLDQLNEVAHRAIMAAYAGTGRPDLARKQYESCVSVLRREGLEPDDATIQLYESLSRNHSASDENGDPDLKAVIAGPGRRRRRRRRRRVAMLATIAVAGTALVSLAVQFRGLVLPVDPSVATLEILENADEVAVVRVGFRNEGTAIRSVPFVVVFSSDGRSVAPRDYEVYRDEIVLGRNAEETIKIDRRADIQPFVGAHRVSIPQGYYSVSVVIDPEETVREESEFNNRLVDPDFHYYSGADGVHVLEVAFTYEGTRPLDNRNPIKVLIGDITANVGPPDWGQFRVTRPGVYYFPESDIPVADTDGSGYFMMLVHDAGDDLIDPIRLASEDVVGLYKNTPGNVVYGRFAVAQGTPIYPGGSYAVRVAPPEPPLADEYEVDDFRELGTLVSYDSLPVRHLHTFHDEGTGDVDQDWFKIFLRRGDSLTVETSYAGGAWECDTQIDIADEQMNYITSNRDKSLTDRYSKLVYVNDTGVDQLFHILVKPSNQFGFQVYPAGEYVVEMTR